MVIEVTFDTTDVYISTTVSPVYVNVSFEAPSGGGGAEWGDITGTLSDQTDLQTALDLKVPYTGATQDVSLGEYGINVGNLIYDTTPTGIPTDQGATYWDDQAETVALVMNGTIQKIGEDTFYHVKNSTGSTIAKGVAVRFAGTDGGSGKILIAPFLANGTYPSQYYMGITAEAITNGSNGKVYHFGKIRGVNTSAFADGDILYCSTSVAGGFQTTAPSAPNNIVVAAAVINAANNGTLMVRTTTGSNINTDEGVLLTTPTSGQVLKYNGSLWVNDSVSGALGYTPANAATTLTINGVTFDLSANRTFTVGSVTGSGASGQVAYWTGTSAQSGSNNLFWDNTNGRLGIGTNVPARQLVIYDGASGVPHVQWANASTGVTNGDGFQIRLLSSNQVHFTNFENSAMYFGNQGITGQMTFYPTGNLAIGTSASDSGQRLQVTGDTLLKGSGNTSGTTALTVQNSDGTNMFRVKNNGEFSIGSNANDAFQIWSAGAAGTLSLAGLNATFYSYATSQNSGFGAFNFWGTTLATTSGFNTQVSITRQFAPTSGSAQMTYLNISPTINQVSATGITRGISVNPSLTAAADWRSIEWSNNSGWGLYGAGTANNYLGGNLLIGTTTNVASSILTLASTTKGFLPPRMTTTQKNAISSPAAGLVVYDTTLNKLCVYTTTWETITSI